MKKNLIIFILMLISTTICNSQQNDKHFLIKRIVDNPDTLKTILHLSPIMENSCDETNSFSNPKIKDYTHKESLSYTDYLIYLINLDFQKGYHILENSDQGKSINTSNLMSIGFQSDSLKITLFTTFDTNNKLVFIGRIKWFNPNELLFNYGVIDSILHEPSSLEYFMPKFFEKIGKEYQDRFLSLLRKFRFERYDIIEDGWCTPEENYLRLSHLITIQFVNSNIYIEFRFDKSDNGYVLNDLDAGPL